MQISLNGQCLYQAYFMQWLDRKIIIISGHNYSDLSIRDRILMSWEIKFRNADNVCNDMHWSFYNRSPTLSINFIQQETPMNMWPPSGVGARQVTLHLHHNEHDGVSNHQPHHCLLNRFFRLRSKKTSKLRVTGLCAGNSPHKWPVTRKMFPFDDVIMKWSLPGLVGKFFSWPDNTHFCLLTWKPVVWYHYCCH